jgi:glycosyltransferase involved in cell wall biosynthesis
VNVVSELSINEKLSQAADSPVTLSSMNNQGLHRNTYVLAFLGENANGILRWWTEKILASFLKHGLSSELIDLRDPGWNSQLNARLSQGRPEFCFSFQGMGTAMQANDGSNFWERTGIPFFTYLGDSPYHAPKHHAAEGRGMFLLYGCNDFFEMYQRFLNGRAYAGTLRYGYPENSAADRTPWSKREHSIVFVKTGVDSEALRLKWADYPKRVSSILQETADLVLSGVDETVATLCARVFAAQPIHCGERREFFLFACSAVDYYVRALRAERMVTTLMRHDALIVGDWSHMDRSSARARFHAPIPADRLDDLYAESRIVVSTSPTVRYGIHERVMAGLLAKSAVLSDTTPFMQNLLKDCPSFLGIDIDQPTFGEQVDSALSSFLADPASPAKVESSAAVARELFSFDAFIQQLLDHVALEKHLRQLDWWTVTPPIQPARPTTI